MCEICHSSPCLSRCPNAPEPEAVYKCAYCKEGIIEGDEYFEYDGKYYHEDCFGECAVDLLVESGATKGTAEKEYPDYDPYDD